MFRQFFYGIFVSTFVLGLASCQVKTKTFPQVSQQSLLSSQSVYSQSLSEIKSIVKEGYTLRFFAHDQDQSKSLSLEEYIPSFNNLPVGVPPSKIAEIFANKDKDKNNFLNVDEFVGSVQEHEAIAKRLQVSAKKLFTSIDLDQNRRVTRAEVARMGLPNTLKYFDRFAPVDSPQDTPGMHSSDFENLMAYVILVADFLP